MYLEIHTKEFFNRMGWYLSFALKYSRKNKNNKVGMINETQDQ